MEQALKSILLTRERSSGLFGGFIDPGRLVHIFLWCIVIILDLVAFPFPPPPQPPTY